jgi:hypothetical protein
VGVDESALGACTNAEEVASAIVRAEDMNLSTLDRQERAALVELADDWLFSPGGRGVRSGLPD